MAALGLLAQEPGSGYDLLKHFEKSMANVWPATQSQLYGELNKLAVNFGFGRNWAGIHWRSDASASMAIGEEVAIGMLRDERTTLREPFDGFSFTRFDGSRVTI